MPEYNFLKRRGRHDSLKQKKKQEKQKRRGSKEKSVSSQLLKSYPSDLIYDLESHLIEMNSPVIYQKRNSPPKQRKLSSLYLEERNQQVQHHDRKKKNDVEYAEYVDEYVQDDEEDEEEKTLEDEVKRLNELLEHADDLNQSIN